MHITIVGTGYVGLVTGTCLAEMGHQVICLDINPSKVEQLSKGQIPIYEPTLEEMVRRNLLSGRLHFTCNYQKACSHSLIFFIAVDTPIAEDGSADMHFIEAVCDSLSAHLNHYAVIVNKSTVPVGSAAFVKRRIDEGLRRRGSSIQIDVVSNPEFLKEGDAVNDFMKPDRIVIGSDSENAIAMMKELYAPFMLSREHFLVMDIASAEMCKYAANAMLASRISFMNEMANLCEKNGADIDKVRHALGADSRIGCKFLYPGVGFGGSCLPKDLSALRRQAQRHDVATPLLDAIETVNSRQKQKLYHMALARKSPEELSKGSYAIWGLAFKAGTDDMRCASSLILIQQLLQAGAALRLYDPVAMDNARSLIPDSPQITWCQDEYDAAKDCDAVFLVTEWKQFRFVDLTKVLQLMRGNDFFDGRNQYVPEKMRELGFVYHSIGRGAVGPSADKALLHNMMEKAKQPLMPSA